MKATLCRNPKGWSLICCLLAIVICCGWAGSIEASETAEAPTTDGIYDDDGGIYTCTAGNSTGYHCQQCRLNFNVVNPYPECIDIDSRGGSGYFECTVRPDGCDVNSGCNVVIVTAF